MKCVIIDDELKSREVLTTLLDQYIEGVEVIGGAADISSGLRLIQEKKPEMVFLDISLKDGDSFAILNQLKTINFKIIFITAFDEYATQAINFTRIPCLNKPIDIDELEHAIKKAINTEILTVEEDVSIILNILNSQFNIIPIIDVFKVTFITDYKIKQINRKGNESEFTLINDEKIISWYPFDRYSHLLKNHSFAQPNKDCLVLISGVKHFPQSGDKHVELEGSLKVLLSEDYKTDFIKRYSAHNNLNK